MPRMPADTDFVVPVEQIGNFTFARRTMRDEIAIQVEYARMIDGVEPTAWLQSVCGWLAALSVLTVRAPDSWDLEALEPMESESYAKLSRVYEELLQKERDFRQKRASGGKGAGAPAV